jgi:hypothetical protein
LLAGGGGREEIQLKKLTIKVIKYEDFDSVDVEELLTVTEFVLVVGTETVNGAIGIERY